MESIDGKSVISAILLVIVIFSGFWLRIKGEPYRAILFNLHKLATAALTVFIVLIYVEHFKLFAFQGLGWFLFVSSSVFFLIAFISGALLSFENVVKFKWKWIHLISSVVTFIMGIVIWMVCH